MEKELEKAIAKARRQRINAESNYARDLVRIMNTLPASTEAKLAALRGELDAELRRVCPGK